MGHLKPLKRNLPAVWNSLLLNPSQTVGSLKSAFGTKYTIMTPQNCILHSYVPSQCSRTEIYCVLENNILPCQIMLKVKGLLCKIFVDDIVLRGCDWRDIFTCDNHRSHGFLQLSTTHTSQAELKLSTTDT